MSPIEIKPAAPGDISAITRIYNEGIASGLGTFETRLREKSEIAEWLAKASTYPVLVASRNGGCCGFARLIAYRPRDCYAGIAEFSIYLDSHCRGQGTGRLLLGELLKVAGNKGFHKVLSRIFTFNTASRRLCAKLGFREVGIYEKHGKLNDSGWTW